ncbi:glutathione S-transferase family protein [Bosea sp. (in: a-proteobacteria)]|uniref:glutathione S-transferase family protein n=1 Tax=Bosea sp. (in: a-proteobacteria) TaxID=1871050 RepID=UPI000A76B2A9|nr:glutathione S-transferase family protein [Bosea sp. (in: a-proteobacteria)]
MEPAKGGAVLTLYFAPGASSMAPHIALNEIGVEFTAIPVSFARQEHRSAAYLALNPEGKVPTLLVEGRPLTEVAAILFYLARRFPATRLLPANDDEAEAQVLSWMSFIASTLHPARRQGLDHARTIYALADRRLGGRYWAARTYSVADIHLFRLFWRFRSSFPRAADEMTNLSWHHDRMMERPAVRRTCETEAAIGYELPA